MRKAAAVAVLFGLAGCSDLKDPVSPQLNTVAVIGYANYCAANPQAGLSALGYAQAGFSYVEQECGTFFDKLSELTQAGRFSIHALNATNLGTQAILQAAKVAAQNVTIVGSSLTLTEAIFNSFVEQYAFAPYLYKVRELTWQALQKHTTDNADNLAKLQNQASGDDYCTANILIQQHANICTLSYLQMMFDQQVANTTKVVNATDKGTNTGTGGTGGGGVLLRSFSAPSSRRFTPLVSPSYTVR